jgi:Pilus formation protein N terminal region
MRHRLATTPLAIVSTLVMCHWSSVNAGASFNVVTAPSDVPQAQVQAQQAEAQNAGSSIKIVTAPAGDVLTAPAGSSFKVVAADSDAKLAQGAPVMPQANEPAPGEPVAREPDTNNAVRREQVLLPPKTERQVSVGGPFTQIVISNPQVLDVLPVNDLDVVLFAKNTGNSDILFYKTGKLIRSLEVTVDNTVFRRDAVTDSEARLPSLRKMEVHNKALLTSQTNFLCGVDGCHYVDEVTVQEPAPLPRGYYNNTNNNNNSGGFGPIPVAPIPATNR